ncbi:MAG: hypothetical protein AAF298_00510 [Cyanobacteria bacterium P01_A01_bin.40]
MTEDTVGTWQEIVVDLLLFRIKNADIFKKRKITMHEFKELDSLVAAFSPFHNPDIATINNLKESNRFERYCNSKIGYGNPLKKEIFKFNTDQYFELLGFDLHDVDEEDELKIVKTIEQSIFDMNKAIETSINDFANHNYFSNTEQLFIHSLFR